MRTIGLALLLAFAAGCSAPQAQPNEFDRQFIDMMVPHHEGAVAMARLALTRATHAELRAFAQSVIGAQESEIATMKGWRREWYGSDATPPMERMPMLAGNEMGHSGSMDMTADVRKLERASDFDREFIDLMREHHESAIDAGRLAEKSAQRKEVRDLAARIIADQQREIAQMTEWRRAWFGAP